MGLYWDSRWPSSTIPFSFDSSIPSWSADRTTILSALTYIESLTQISFSLNSTPADRIIFEINTLSPWAWGQSNTLWYAILWTTITLSAWVSAWTVVHEVCHALGIAHEQKRSDRDTYVCVYSSNITDLNYITQYYDIIPWNLFEWYDYESIMHYSETGFLKNSLWKSMESPIAIGNRDYLSRGDIRLLRRLVPDNVHIHQIDPVNMVGDLVLDTTASHAVKMINVFNVDGKTYYSYYLQPVSQLWVKQIKNNLSFSTTEKYTTLSNTVANIYYYTEWTETYCITSDTYISSSWSTLNRVNVYDVNSDGTLWSIVDTLNKSFLPGIIKTYTIWTDTYLLMYDTAWNNVDLYPIVNWVIGSKLCEVGIGLFSGVSYVEFFYHDSIVYLFAYSTSSWDAKLYTINSGSDCKRWNISTLVDSFSFKSWVNFAKLNSASPNTHILQVWETTGEMYINKWFHHQNIAVPWANNSFSLYITESPDSATWEKWWSNVQSFVHANDGKEYVLLANNDWDYIHIHEIQTHKSISEEVQRYDWTDGWSTAEFFNIRSKTFLFLLKESTWDVHIHEMNSDGAVGTKVFDANWTSGWTKARFYTVGTNTYLFLLKKSDGTVHIHKMKSDGTLDGTILNSNTDWTSGWTGVEFFTTTPWKLWISQTYLFLYKSGTGSMKVHKVEDDWNIGEEIQNDEWTSGWTHARFYRTNEGLFLFLLKEGDGSMHINKVWSNGKIGAIAHSDNWTNGWSSANFLTIATSKNTWKIITDVTYDNYLILLKSSDWSMHYHRVNDDGSIWDTIKNSTWTEWWTKAKFFEVDGNNYLFLLKKEGTGKSSL